MKARRVIVTLELETDAPISVLRTSLAYRDLEMATPKSGRFKAQVIQAQANVIKQAKAGRGKK